MRLTLIYIKGVKNLPVRVRPCTEAVTRIPVGSKCARVNLTFLEEEGGFTAKEPGDGTLGGTMFRPC